MAASVYCLLAFLMAFNGAQALTCYKCDSSNSMLCAYGMASFLSSTTVCEQGSNILTNIVPHQCAKFVATTQSGKEYIARDCAPAVGSTVCNMAAKAAGVFSSLENEKVDISCSLCSEDKCNSATRFTGLSLLGLLLASIVFMI